MHASAPATELMPLPEAGRRFDASRTVRLGDVDPGGLVRFDAIARHLQDVATDDVTESGLENQFGWVVRRTLLDVRRPAALGERIQLTTYCSGTGRCWAERRTSIVGDGGGAIEAVALWVQVDPVTGRPARLDDGFHDIYGPAADGRHVSTRLGLTGPTATAELRPWAVRRVDLDVFDHVNNASHWAILEETVAGPGFGRDGVAEIEYPMPVDLDDRVALHVDLDGHPAAWLVSGRGDIHTAARWTPRDDAQSG